MEDIKLRLPSMWDNDPFQVSPVLLLKKGAERRQHQREIIVEVLKNVDPRYPTARQLQKLCGIRRCRFLPLLKAMVEKGTVQKRGRGTKNNPFVYMVDPEYLSDGQQRVDSCP